MSYILESILSVTVISTVSTSASCPAMAASINSPPTPTNPGYSFWELLHHSTRKPWREERERD